MIGRRDIMDAAQTTFISSSFWTERIGPTAALKTLEVMECEQSRNRITEIRRLINDRWKELARKHALSLGVNGLPSMSSFSFPLPDMLKYKTLITQEMLKAGFLATPLVYVCTSHTPDVLDRYIDALDPVFGLISECERGRSIDDLLEGPVCHAGFSRLN